MLRGSCVSGCLLVCGILFPPAALGQIYCTPAAQPVPDLRQEGATELTADVVLDCTGSTATQFFTFSVYFNANVTSRAFSPTLVEALLLIDDPAVPVLGVPGRAGGNVFVAQAGAVGNALVWANIPLTSPGYGGRRRLRFKNLRVNATGVTRDVIALVHSESSAVQINIPQVRVGAVAPGLAFSVRDGRNPSTALAGPLVVPSGLATVTEPAAWLRFTEGFESAFRVRGETAANPAGTSTPGYGTESGFKLGLVVGADLTAGRADFGTRLTAAFAQIPQGVHVWTGLQDGNGRARLTAGPATAFQPVPASAVVNGVQVAEVPLAGGAGMAVWEVVADPAGTATFDFPIYFTTDAAVGDGTGTVSGRLGPASMVFIGDRDSPIPRFYAGYGRILPLVSARNVPPVIPLSVSCSPAAGPVTVGIEYLTVCTPAGGQSPYQWSISEGMLPDGLFLTSWGGATAKISGTPTTAGAYRFTVTVQDGSTPANRASQVFSGTISPPAPSIAVTCVPSSGPTVAGTRYTTACTAANGVAPLRWSISAGALPAGLTLNPATGDTVTIAGTPSATGSYDFTVTVTDNNSRSASQRFSGTVAAALLSAICVPGQGPSTVGIPYATSCRAEGGVAPYSWSIREGKLPEGLTLSGATGAAVQIAGSPTAAGAYSFVVGVTDASNPAQSAGYPFSGSLSFAFKTFNAAGFLEGTISADSIASLYGFGLALRTESCGGRVTTTLGGATVKVVDSTGTGRDAQLFYASSGQINLLVPKETAAGSAVIRVTREGGAVALTSGPVTVSDVAPGIFVVSGGSSVPAAFYLRVTPDGQRTQNYTFDPATLAAIEIPRDGGDAIYLLLYGTGFRRWGGRVSATAGGEAVPVLGAVAQVEFAGLDQVNIGPLPASLPSGAAKVRLEFDGIPANNITVRLK